MFGLFGFSRQPITVAVGAASCSASNCLDTTLPGTVAMPVTLPPGRLKLATRPSWTGSALVIVKTMGTVVLVALRHKRRGRTTEGGDHGHLAAKEIGRQLRQTFVMLLGAAIFAPDIEALDIASFL
jgi:hypothetical protein